MDYFEVITNAQTGEQTIRPYTEAEIATLLAPRPKTEQEELRRIAYTSEADPLFFKWQAGEAAEEEWLAKRQEIRDRYPYPAE
jgi:hypothetical protein